MVPFSGVVVVGLVDVDVEVEVDVVDVVLIVAEMEIFDTSEVLTSQQIDLQNMESD